jgi:hypothetical protein
MVVLRRLGITVAGLGVAALGAVACVLSFEDLRALALAGRARPELAYLYPAGFDALLAVALISVLLLRRGGLPVRLQAGTVLGLLLVAAAAANVAMATEMTLDARQAAVVVAVVPWVMLAMALWLWLLLIKHAQAQRAALDRIAAALDHDIVPFAPPEDQAVGVGRRHRPKHAALAPRPEETAAPSSTREEAATPPPATVREEAVAEPSTTEPPVSEPVLEPTTERAAGPVRDAADEPRAERPEPTQEEPSGDDSGWQDVREPATEPERPLQWGDISRPPGRRPERRDVLVHPLPPSEPEPQAGRVGEQVETWETPSAAREAPRPEETSQPEQAEPAGAAPAGRGFPDPADDQGAASDAAEVADRRRPYDAPGERVVPASSVSDVRDSAAGYPAGGDDRDSAVGGDDRDSAVGGDVQDSTVGDMAGGDDRDTQPLRMFGRPQDAVPTAESDPAHPAVIADPEEFRNQSTDAAPTAGPDPSPTAESHPASAAEPEPYRASPPTAPPPAPPSGRMRSTPVPPEDGEPR